jgi:hypothetical protein
VSERRNAGGGVLGGVQLEGAAGRNLSLREGRETMSGWPYWTAGDDERSRYDSQQQQCLLGATAQQTRRGWCRVSHLQT